jgi:hypothetical protein
MPMLLFWLWPNHGGDAGSSWLPAWPLVSASAVRLAPTSTVISNELAQRTRSFLPLLFMDEPPVLGYCSVVSEAGHVPRDPEAIQMAG